MAPLRGWAARGKRLIGKAPFGHCVNAGSKLAHLAEVKLTHPGEEQARVRGVST